MTEGLPEIELGNSAASDRLESKELSFSGMRLDLYRATGFDRGRTLYLEAAWQLVQILVVRSPLSSSWLRGAALKLFGAQIGRGVTIRAGVRVKFPWRLQVGNHCWIGEDVWFDNLAEIRIGNHCCISQGAYLCTGSHDWQKLGFDLVVRPITLEDEVWLAARSVVGPGVVCGRGAVLGLGSIATRNMISQYIHQGVPAIPVKSRQTPPRLAP
jgi:putative colanic acid biosynthesis acetyltransferase WcaF